MTEHDLEPRLSGWYRTVESESASNELHAHVAAIPEQVPESPSPPVAGTRPRTLLLVAAMVSVVALGSALVFVGGQERTSVIPSPVSSAVPTSAPPSVAPLPETKSGVADTPIGRVSWTRVDGDSSTVPAGEIVGAAGSEIAIQDWGHRSEGARFWRFVDGAWVDLGSPLATVGAVRHAIVRGEFVVWDEGFNLWRGGALEHIALDPLAPKPIAAVEWRNDAEQALAIGGRMILPWSFWGHIRFDELLGIGSAELEIADIDDLLDTSPDLGEVRGIFDSPPSISAGQDPLASVRVEARGTVAVMIDADSGRTILEIDASRIGVPVAELWEGMYRGYIPGPTGGAVVDGDGLEPFTPPVAFIPRYGTTLAYAVIEPDVVAFVGTDPQASINVWTSADIADWTQLPDAHVDGAAVSSLRPRPDIIDPTDRGRLAAEVELENGGRNVLAFSPDGSTWEPAFDLTPLRETGHSFIQLASGGYVALTDPSVSVSADGQQWVPIDGLSGIGSIVGEEGGSLGDDYLTETDTLVISEVGQTRRALWTLTFEPAP